MHYCNPILDERSRRRFTLETLESRQLLAATIQLAEVESNNSFAAALPIDIGTARSAALTGRASSPADRDYFRVKVAANARLQVTIINLSRASVKLRVIDSTFSSVASTTKNTSVFLDGGRWYFIKLQSNSPRSASYRVELNAYTSEVSDKRLGLLRKGVNLPEWFWNVRGNVRSAMQNYIDRDDVLQIKRLGFGHVRLPVDMKYFFDSSNRISLSNTYLGELDAAVSLLESHGLAVIVCPFGDHQNWLEYGGEARGNAMAFTWALSKFLSQYDSDLTFIQTTNEPLGGGSDWQGLQGQLIQTIRSAAPNNTIITATPLYYGPNESSFGTTGAINELGTYRDTNIVYGLHFYEPFVFTHQGAVWAIPGMQFIAGLSYPADVDQTNAIGANLLSRFAGTQYEPVVDLVRYYGFDKWGRSKVEDRLKVASNWAQRNGVPMILDEFGVYGLNVDDASRYRYLKDVRTIAESAGFGWTMWDFNTEFGVVSSNGSLRYDIVAALDLSTP